MKIDFNEIQEVANPQFKGGVGDTMFRYHSHETNSEIIYVLSGEARCLYDGGEERLVPGQCHYCPKGHSHALINGSATKPLTFIAIVPEQ